VSNSDRSRSHIYLCYRREDSSDASGRLYDWLERRYGSRQVFRDLDQMRTGRPFPVQIADAIASSCVVVVVIGSHWLETLRARDGPDDYVRFEIRTALERGVTILPVLLDGAVMPEPSRLPDDIRDLGLVHAAHLSDGRWRSDTVRLCREIDGLVPQPGRRRLTALVVLVLVALVVVGTLATGYTVFRWPGPSLGSSRGSPAPESTYLGPPSPTSGAPVAITSPQDGVTGPSPTPGPTSSPSPVHAIITPSDRGPVSQYNNRVAGTYQLAPSHSLWLCVTISSTCYLYKLEFAGTDFQVNSVRFGNDNDRGKLFGLVLIDADPTGDVALTKVYGNEPSQRNMPMSQLDQQKTRQVDAIAVYRS
jgi:hypothetical protein